MSRLGVKNTLPGIQPLPEEQILQLKGDPSDLPRRGGHSKALAVFYLYPLLGGMLFLGVLQQVLPALKSLVAEDTAVFFLVHDQVIPSFGILTAYSEEIITLHVLSILLSVIPSAKKALIPVISLKTRILPF